MPRNAKARALIVSSLLRVEKENSYANELLQSLAQRQDLSQTELRIVQKVVRGVLEQRTVLKERLNSLVPKGADSLPPPIRVLLLAALYQIDFLDRVSPALVVDESVHYAKKKGFHGLRGLVNAVLRRALREEAPSSEPEETAEGLARAKSHPEWLVRRWVAAWGFEEARKLCDANNGTLPLCVRVNTLRVSTEECREVLQAEGLVVKAAPFARDSLHIQKMAAKRRLHELGSFAQGLFFVQDESSALVVDLARPTPGEILVDLCSAPGGKTCNSAIQMQNEGQIFAVDTSKRKLEKLEATCKRLGITNVRTVQGDGRTYSPHKQPEVVLTDVPCSGSGVLGRRADMRWSKTEQDLLELLPLQASLAMHAMSFLPQGRMVYSTCSIDGEENEAHVAKLLELPGVTRRTPDASFPPEVLSAQGDLRTFPHRHGMAGAYAALLGKE